MISVSLSGFFPPLYKSQKQLIFVAPLFSRKEEIFEQVFFRGSVFYANIFLCDHLKYAEVKNEDH